MPERKQFKTKLCQLYQKGHCARRGCSFAHGDAELRRFSASYNIGGRRGHQSTDLRNKLDRRDLSPRRYSPPRDTKGRYSIQEKSSSRSFEKTGERIFRKTGRMSGQNDISGSRKFSDGNRNQAKEEFFLTADPRDSIQVEKLEVDINILDNKKRKLEAHLEEKAQEVDSLNYRIQELEAELHREDEECQRISSRIRKIVMAHREHSSLQDELKRSQARLQRIGDQLASEITKFGVNEEDLSIDIVSNGEHTDVPLKNNRELNNASPFRKRLLEVDAPEASKKGKRGDPDVAARPKKRSKWNVSVPQNNVMDPDGLDPHITRPTAYESKSKKGKYASDGLFFADKAKDSDSRPLVPPTSMAAYAADNEVEIELGDKFDLVDAGSIGDEKDATHLKRLPPLPPPPLPLTNNYSQYEGNDDRVDVDGPDVEEENCNVDIVDY